MNTREQLEELEEYFSRLLQLSNSMLTKNLTPRQARDLVKKLIAERPYGPGEKIEVKVREEGTWKPALFVGVDPIEPDFIIARTKNVDSGVLVWRYRFHRRLTYQRNVPEDVIEAAQKIYTDHHHKGAFYSDLTLKIVQHLLKGEGS